MAGSRVYVGSNDGNIYALDAATGIRLWNFTTGDAIWSSPAVADGVVYVGSNDDNVYALDAATSAKLWNYTTGGHVESCPVIDNGTVYVGSDDGNIYAIGSGLSPAPVPGFTATVTSGAAPLPGHLHGHLHGTGRDDVELVVRRQHVVQCHRQLQPGSHVHYPGHLHGDPDGDQCIRQQHRDTGRVYPRHLRRTAVCGVQRDADNRASSSYRHLHGSIDRQPTGWAWFFGDENYTEPWTEVNASAGWTPREGQSSVATPDGSIVLMGGSTTDIMNSLNNVWSSKDDGATWTEANASARVAAKGGFQQRGDAGRQHRPYGG